ASLLEIWGKTRQTIVFVTHDLMEAITLSDRIIIMSGRPGRVKASYPITIPRPRDVIKVKDSEEYLDDFREIWRILGEELVRGGPHDRRAEADQELSRSPGSQAPARRHRGQGPCGHGRSRQGRPRRARRALRRAAGARGMV